MGGFNPDISRINCCFYRNRSRNSILPSLPSLFDPRRDCVSSAHASPFVLQNEAEYQCWRKQKLELRQQLKPTKVFSIGADLTISESMQNEIMAQTRAYNFICFDTDASLSRQDFLKLNLEYVDRHPSFLLDLRIIAKTFSTSSNMALVRALRSPTFRTAASFGLVS